MRIIFYQHIYLYNKQMAGYDTSLFPWPTNQGTFNSTHMSIKKALS